MIRRRWTTLASLLVAALLLAGCGGGGGESEPTVSQALYDELQGELDAALAAQTTAETARAAAEEARATADVARRAADEARATAETERDAALAAQMEAEAAQAEAVAAEAEAVAAQAEAEAAQTAAEAARDAAVQAKTAAETARDEARDGETQAKIDLIAAQSAQKDAERERDRAKAAQTAAETAQTAAETAQAAAEAAQATAEAERDTALTAKQAAETARDAALAAKAQAESDLAAANAQNADDVDAVRQQLADANADLKTAQDNLKTAQDDLKTAQDNLATAIQQRDAARTDLQVANARLEEVRRQLTQAQQDLQQARQDVQQAENEADQRVADAETQANINVRAPLLISILGELTAANATALASVTHTGGRRTFVRPSNLPSKGSAPGVPGGWGSASFSGPRGTVGTDTVYLYTNIGSPGSKAFWKEYGENVPNLSGAFAADADPRVTVSGFGLPAKTLLATDSTNQRSVGGTYDGYSGTFRCPSGCNVETAADTEALTFTGTWTFTAGLTAKRSSLQAEQDTEFLYFGIWAFEPTNPADTTNEHDFDFVFGGDADDITNFGTLTGTATFAGGAIGNYALAKVGGREAKIGTFTATASFTADFDTAPDGSDGNRISGRIADFKEGGSSLGSDWHVFLGGSASTPATLAASGATGVTAGSIDGDTASGAWAAGLHGSPNNVTLDRTKYPVSRYPVADLAGVAGWFEAAAGTNAAIAGTFGAACTATSGGNAGCAP